MNIPANRYLFQIIPLEETRLPAYKGSTFRGGFGHAFRKVVCTFKGKECDNCLLKHRCIYSYVFETPPPESGGEMSNYHRAPHPFIIEPPLAKKTGYAPGEAISFSLVLIGKADEYLPYFIYAFDELGKLGIGKGKAKFRLDAVRQNGKQIFDGATGILTPPGREQTPDRDGAPSAATTRHMDADNEHGQRIALRFLTPLRIVSNGQLNTAPDFQTLIRTLLHRITLLSHFHCGIDPQLDCNGLTERAGKVITEFRSLRWHDWERWSSRQNTRMKMGGLVGKIVFRGELEEFLPYLRMGELLHIGKGTAFGLGWYEIR